MSDYLALPDEVVAETILWRLPVKSIIQCMCVCKSWYSLITSPDFISTHLVRRKTLTLTQNPQIFLNQNDSSDQTGKFLLYFDKEDYFDSILLRLPHIPPNPFSQIVGSVNGLICFSIGQDCVNRVLEFILFNPSIRRFQSVRPPVVRTWEVKGFGYDERTQDYKILLMIPDTAHFIYSFNLNSWSSIVPPLTPGSWGFEVFNSVVFANGRLLWLARESCSMSISIWVFDVKTETFGQISLPECLSTNGRLLSFIAFGESSVAVIEQTSNYPTQRHVTENHIWVMKEYGLVESWIKLATIRLRSGELVLGFRNADEVFIKRKTGSCITLHKINKDKLELDLEEVKKVMHVDHIPSMDFSVHTYVPSLVLLDKEDNVDVAAPIHTIFDIVSPTPRRKRITKSVAHESPAAQIGRRSQRIKHQPAKYTDFI